MWLCYSGILAVRSYTFIFVVKPLKNNFLSTGVQEKLGILSGGVVYAVFDYTAQQPDELSFKAGQQLTVLRKGDENEREWWWSRLGDKEGYVPRNLLGVSFLLVLKRIIILTDNLYCFSCIRGFLRVKNEFLFVILHP